MTRFAFIPVGAAILAGLTHALQAAALRDWPAWCVDLSFNRPAGKPNDPPYLSAVRFGHSLRPLAAGRGGDEGPMTVALALSPQCDCAPAQGFARLAGPSQEAKLSQDDPWELLLDRANAGDGAAFARFLTAVTPSLRAVIRRRGHALPHDQHEDILQEVLLAIHLKRHTWRRAEPLRPWLYAVARYKVVDAFRRRGSWVTLPIEDFADILPAEAAAMPLALRDAHVMLAQIDPRSARMVQAVALEGKTAEEAGKTLGLTAGTARVVLHRAMRRLTEVAERMLK